jgi:hypothetical protein
MYLEGISMPELYFFCRRPKELGFLFFLINQEYLYSMKKPLFSLRRK